MGENRFGKIPSRRRLSKFQSDLGGQRWLVGVRNSRKIRDLSGPSLAVEPLGITSFADLQRRIHKHLDEITALTRGLDLASRAIAIAAIGTDKRRQNNQPCGDEQFADRGDSADVFLTILRPKAQPEPLRKCFPVLRDQQRRRCTQRVPNVVTI